MKDIIASISGPMDDMSFPVCTGASRLSKKWKNTNIRWSQLITKTASTKRSEETVEQYHAMNRDGQTEIKDIGGIVCGHLKHDKTSDDKALSGRKTKDNILNRSIITLDMDECPEGLNPIEIISEKLPDVEAIAYTTHKHTPQAPRWRVFIPLSEWVTPFYYEGIARWIGNEIGMQFLDKTTFQYNRLMYWPSTSIDGEFKFDRVKGFPISPRKFYEAYPAMKRESAWPRHPDEDPVEKRSPLQEREGEYTAAGKPVTASTKAGIIGAFCRAYPIEEAINTFLSEVYTPQGLGRYTYINGSSSGGLVIYEGQFAYSNHATDPANTGHDVNAFDLVRIHKFGYLDKKSGKNTLPQNLPSYKAMCDLTMNDPRASQIYRMEKQAEAASEFDGIDEKLKGKLSEEPDFSFVEELKMDGKGKYTKCLQNQETILLNDPITSRIRYDEFHKIDIIDDPSLLDCHTKEINDTLCWNIVKHIQNTYGIDFSTKEIADAIVGVRGKHWFNPVQDYIRLEEWDGTPRIETILIRCLGAPSTELVRMQTRKWFIGAVRRAFVPGCKLDYMMVLTGPQGVGKSQFLSIISNEGEFFDDSAAFDMKDKELVEHLNSAWILEFAELNGLKSQKETEKVKSFLSQCKDFMRSAYARFGENHYRHCALAATTNENSFLSDVSSRKFWVIPVNPVMPFREWNKILRSEVHQLWAEAYVYYTQGEPNYLPDELEIDAREEQAKRNTASEDPMLGVIIAYLEYRLPGDWRKSSRESRCNYIRTYSEKDIDLTACLRRNSICAAEIKNELDHWFRPYEKKMSSQYVNRLLNLTGWKLYDDGNPKLVDGIYGRQRNVFIRPGTDGQDSQVNTPPRKESTGSNAPLYRGFDDEDDDDL